MSSLPDHTNPDDSLALQEWLNRHASLGMMDKKELLLLLLYKLDLLQLSINDIQLNTKTHWTPDNTIKNTRS